MSEDYLALVVPCEGCGQRWCTKCEGHWADCLCPGPGETEELDGFMIDLRAAKRLKHDVSQLGHQMREVLPDDLGDGLRDKIGDILISASALL